MITNGNRRSGQPIHLKGTEANILERIPLNERSFSEVWIQQLINNYPSILPVSEIEASFNPLISIGREISTSVGPLDNLFVSPDGYLTIVETKLWRNPEARREVVGQIIDYAKELSRWSFTDLDRSVISSNCLYNNCNTIKFLRSGLGRRVYILIYLGPADLFSGLSTFLDQV